MSQTQIQTQSAKDDQVMDRSRSSVNRGSETGSDGDSTGDENQAESNSKKRKRSMKISCELCKARKVKCDKAEPACSWCKNHDRKCVYLPRKRPGVRASYEIDLEEKVNRIEAMLHLLGSKVEDHIASDQCFRPSTADMPHLRSPTVAGSNRFTPATIDTDIRAVSTWRPEIGRHDSVSMRSVVGDNRDANHNHILRKASLQPSEGDGDLPPYDLLYSLVDLYFKHVATWSPILDRKNTFDALFGRAVLEEPDRVLLHAIVAVTLRFSKDPRLNAESRKHYHDVSKHKVQLYGLETPNIQALQALVILAIDILGTTNGPAGWNLLALIARNVVQLGLNVEKSVYLAAAPYPSISCLQAYAISQPTSWTESEARRRLFWMVYVLDRYTTVSTSFNFTLDDAEVDRPLPCSYDLFSQNEAVETKWFRWPEQTETIINNPDNLGSFAYHCEVLRILSRIHRFLNHPIDITVEAEVSEWRKTYLELDTDLNAFIAQLPGDYGRISQLCHSDPASKISNWIMLHAAFVLSVTRLHSAVGYPVVCSPIFMPDQQAMQRCLAAVDSLKAIAHDVVDSNGLDLLGPPFAFSLWVAARVLIVHAAATESALDLEQIGFFIRTLESMGHFWELASRYSMILGRLVSEGQRAHDLHHSSGTNQHARSFTAMRSLAYDLSRLVSQRPHSVLSPTSTRLTSLNELEYLDVFDFFNYPRIRSAQHQSFVQTTPPTDKSDGLLRFNELRSRENGPRQTNTTEWYGYRNNAG